jgi:hypothetical protein
MLKSLLVAVGLNLLLVGMAVAGSPEPGTTPVAPPAQPPRPHYSRPMRARLAPGPREPDSRRWLLVRSQPAAAGHVSAEASVGLEMSRWEVCGGM